MQYAFLWLMEKLIKRKVIKGMVEVYKTVIDDVVIQVIVDDSGNITDIGIYHGNRKIIFSSDSEYNNIEEGIEFMRHIVDLDSMEKIRQYTIQTIDKKLRQKGNDEDDSVFRIDIPNIAKNMKRFIHIDGDIDDPDYSEIQYEKELEKRNRKK